MRRRKRKAVKRKLPVVKMPLRKKAAKKTKAKKPATVTDLTKGRFIIARADFVLDTDRDQFAVGENDGTAVTVGFNPELPENPWAASSKKLATDFLAEMQASYPGEFTTAEVRPMSDFYGTENSIDTMSMEHRPYLVAKERAVSFKAAVKSARKLFKGEVAASAANLATATKELKMSKDDLKKFEKKYGR